MKARKISPLDFLVFLVVVVIFVLVTDICEKKFDLQKINDEQKINIDNYQNQTNILQAKIFDLQKKNELLTTEKNKAIEQIQTTTKENKSKEKDISIIKILEEDNNKLNNILNFLVIENNSLRETVTFATNDGDDKPKKQSATPQVVISRGSYDRKNYEDLINLSQGSYLKGPQKINYPSEEISKWQDLGEWYVTRYTATKEECGNDEGITADGNPISIGFSIAIDTNYWKFGTIFYIEGLGFCIASDTGTAIKGRNRADFSLSSKKFSLAIKDDYRNVWLVYSPPSPQKP